MVYIYIYIYIYIIYIYAYILIATYIYIHNYFFKAIHHTSAITSMIKNMTTVRRLGSRVWGRGRRSVRADVEGMVRFEEVRRRRTLNPKP